MKTIEIDKELILVEVPKDAFDLYTLSSSNELIYKLGNRWIYTGINCIIIGIIETPDLKFDFDVNDDWVDKCSSLDGKVCMDFKTGLFSKMTKEQSFRTRIQKTIQDASLYLENPYGKEIKNSTFAYRYFNDIEPKYEQAEERTIKGNLLLIKKLK